MWSMCSFAGAVGGEPARAKQLLAMVNDLDGDPQLVGINPDDDDVCPVPGLMEALLEPARDTAIQPFSRSAVEPLSR